MDINPTQQGLGTGGVQATQSTALTDATGDMGKDEFLNLLTAQLQNQDPLNPLQNHEFVAQLAQFSALEQQMVTNSRLEQVQMAQLSLANGQLAGFIGKEVVARGDSVNIEGGEAQPIGIELGAAAEKVTVTVTNEAGQVVKIIERNKVQAGTSNIEWSPTDLEGVNLQDGRYRVSIEAETAEGAPIPANTLMKGVVEGITFENGYPELIVGLARILPGDVLSINGSQGGDAAGMNPIPVIPNDPGGNGPGNQNNQLLPGG